MNLQKKALAILIAIALVVTIAGCGVVPISLTPQWSYRDSEDELAIGVYTFSLYNAYYDAAEYAKDAEGYSEIESFLDLMIATDDTSPKVRAEDWIYSEAEKRTKAILAVKAECRERNLVASQDELDAAKATAKENWEKGENADFYAQYGYYVTPLKDVLEPYGISFESYLLAGHITSIEQTMLFKDIYQKDGTNPVPEDEIVKYFESNYTDYSYFGLELAEGVEVTEAETTAPESQTSAETEETTVADSEGTTEPTTTAVPETTMVEFSEKRKLEESEKFGKYIKMVNEDGKSFADAVKAYREDYDVESDPTTANTVNLDTSSLPEDFITALDNLEEGKAVLKEFESDNYLYAIYKGKISEKTKAYIADEDKRTSLIIEMKRDEFTEYIDKLTEEFECEKNNSAINSYKASMFEDYEGKTVAPTEAPTEASEDEADTETTVDATEPVDTKAED